MPQYDESTRSAVLHERVLLGAQAHGLVLRESQRLVYRDGVASIEPPQQARQR